MDKLDISKVVGRYRLIKQENFEDFLKAMGKYVNVMWLCWHVVILLSLIIKWAIYDRESIAF